MKLAVLLLTLLLLSACASYPQLVMENRRTGATVDCQYPDLSASPAGFLVSHACLAACQAHGYYPKPGVQAPPGDAGIPDECSN